ncbi:MULTISPECIES: glycosyltransferase [unclassified Paenibacillus]|uniref:glycosyltransferase n=1 Tax=unclassified Paenibacillus TaxID=185978 RepID=UPI002378CD91|nr:glycosyltransferase family 2 protein [Paenibacillus sp. MAHUQ-63]MDD9269646.1 glycosyltransferase family 2 protein [Paenibacillus sp. MAHUQ-63]
MITVSLCMIVKNEEDSIERCLNSVCDIVDEIIIVDTGSNDQTKAIVRKYTERIYDFVWVDDFAAARNYAFNQASMQYIFWLDADDILMEKDRIMFAALKETLAPSIDSVTMNYHLAFDEFGELTTSLRRNRLVKRSNHFQWIGAVHEYLEVWGVIINSDIAVTHSSLHHDNDRNLRIYENRLSHGEQFSPRDLYYFANELLDHRRFEEAISYYEKFLATGKGWVEDNISACGKLADAFHKLGDHQNEFHSSLRSFQFGPPRAEFCCRIGYHFLDRNDIQSSIFWYTLATQLELSNETWGVVNPVYSTWLPHLQLCVCYDRIGKYELAYQQNEAARRYRPNDKRIIQNKSYLESKLGRESSGKGETGRV